MAHSNTAPVHVVYYIASAGLACALVHCTAQAASVFMCDEAMCTTVLARLGVFVCALSVVTTTGWYALSDRCHHVPASPVDLLLTIYGTLRCLLLLLPVVPIAALRLVGRCIVGIPLLQTAYANGPWRSILRDSGSFSRSMQLRRDLAAASTFAELREAAGAIDKHEGREAWRESRHSAHFDFTLVDNALSALVQAPAALTHLMPRVCTASLNEAMAALCRRARGPRSARTRRSWRSC